MDTNQLEARGVVKLSRSGGGRCAIESRSPTVREQLKQKLPELLQLERLIAEGECAAWLDARTETQIEVESVALPLYSLSLGDSASPNCLLLTGGIHGVERIGTQVLLAWLDSLLNRLSWNAELRQQLHNIHLVLLPIVNPAGMWANSRSNGAGVDLNRSAPIDALERVPWLAGGHRVGNWLPWYRGAKGAALQPEVQVLDTVLGRLVAPGRHLMALDLHSGFGFSDRIWLPYAYRREAIDNVAAYAALKLLWQRSYANQIYAFEPQSRHYLSHGDLWDYFYRRFRSQLGSCTNEDYAGGATFMPLTLEMGSWQWVKKRPLQLLHLAGLFNPQPRHRHARVLRRHLALLDFLLAASANSQAWLPDDERMGHYRQLAKTLWYSDVN